MTESEIRDIESLDTLGTINSNWDLEGIECDPDYEGSDYE